MQEQNTKNNMNITKQKLRKIRRKNAKLYPMYKMFSWDLLCFYSIQFLFYSITKQITASGILMINGFYMFFRVLCQIPGGIISNFLGKRNSIIFGNMLYIAFMLILLFLPGAFSIIVANLFFALGYDIKINTEPNLLYDSVSTRGGDGLYSKLDTRGGSLYYILDGCTSLIAGYLFVINNYIPIIISLGFIVISTILSFQFRDVHVKVKKGTKEDIIKDLKEYKKDLKKAFKFIIKSNRMRAFTLFGVIFYGLIKIVEIYQSALLIKIGIPKYFRKDYYQEAY